MYDKSRFYGIDPEYSREASNQMEANASNLKGMVDGISSLVDSVLWIGPAASKFKQDWDGNMRPQLQTAHDSLHENATELRRRADLQDEVSR